MDLDIPTFHLRLPQRFRNSIPFLLALLILFFIGWSFRLVWIYPDDGIRILTPTGMIDSIDVSGPSYSKLIIGDKIIAVDGVPLSEAVPFYVGKESGDQIHYLVLRNNQTQTIVIELAKPALNERMRRVMPLLVALIFWVIGVSVLAFVPTNEATGLLFWFFLAISVLLSSGQISNIGSSWTADIYNFIVWIIGPLSVHFHLFFPQTTNVRGKKILLGILYTIGLIGGILYLAWGSKGMRSSEWFPAILTISRLLLTLSLVLVIGLLIYAYRYAISPGVKAKIRIVALGGVISILPLLTLVLLPEALFRKPLQPYEYVLVWIGLLPLTYGYAIFRYHLIEIERHVNRGASYLLVFSTLVGCYLILSFLIHLLVPVTVENEPYLDMLMVLILALIIVPIYQQVQRIVDTAFYGGWYDYRSAMTQITWGMEQITDLKFLAEILSERLVKTLHLEDTCVFLCDNNGDFSVIDVAPHKKISAQDRLQMPILPRSSLQYLLKIGREERASLTKTLSEVTLSAEEHQLLNSEQVHLWVPIIGHGQVKGFLALGSKYGGDIFSAEDMDILRVVARQVAPVVENINFLTQLKQYAAELETRVKERTAELHDAKERVEAILSSVGDGVVVTDLDGTILTVNAALEEQSAYKKSELVGKKLEFLLAEDNDLHILDEMRTTLPQGNVWAGELINKRKNGTKYDIYMTIAPVRDQMGQMVSFVGSQRDITRQKELDRLKDLFVADVSHELRTPTTNINLYLELLENAPSEKIAGYLTVLKEQGLLLRKLVEDILDLSRLTLGKTKIVQFSAVDINLLAEQVITAHQPLLRSSGLMFEYCLNENLPLVHGEPNQLSRVITNLVANAIQYTNKGKIWLRTYKNLDKVFIEIEDTGIGIDKEDMGHIFERFYRGKQVRQSRIHGTGLGLAIVKEIVEFHGGNVQVDSEIGKGSKFTVGIPIHEAS
jgi:PAS domain S-box-containing protein